MSRSVSSRTLEWEKDIETKKRINYLVKNLSLDWIKTNDIVCFKSRNSKARAYARIWGLSRVWQLALDEKPKYIIEVLSEKYDKLNQKQKDKVLLHELTHIPKNFSGSLIPHIRKRGKRNFYDKVNTLVKKNASIFR